MREFYPSRRAFSLIETLVAIAILAILIGLVLVAVQRVREAALLTQNKNNMRQMIFAIHQLADQKEGAITDLMKTSMKGVNSAPADRSIYFRMIPYVYGAHEYRENMSAEEHKEYMCPTVKVYRNPADPSWDIEPVFANLRGKCSYALNMVALNGSVSLLSSLPDGSSQTIAIGDKYFTRSRAVPTVAQLSHLYNYIWDPLSSIYGDRRPTFADRGWQDVIPITDPNTLTTRASVPGKTFQVKPLLEEVDQHILSTPFRAGLTVALFDGSVRTLAPGISESTFWSMVTPASGEVVPVE